LEVILFKNLVKQIVRPIKFDDNATYDLISVRRRSGGILRRGVFVGHEIKTKQMYAVQKGDFLISKMQIVHSASALVEEEFDGLIISGSYIAMRIANHRKLDVNFLNWLSKTPYFYHLAFLASYGVHIEKMTFNLRLFLKSKFKIPEKIQEQCAIVDILKTVDNEINQLEKKSKP